MKRTMLIIMALSLFSLQLFALGGKEKAAVNLPDITISAGAIKGPSGIGMIYLFAEKPALPQNAQLAVEAFASADAIAAKLLSGELDIAVLPVNMAAKLYNSGIDYPMLAVVGNGMLKLVSTDPAVKGIADLRGKDLYVAGQGATPEFLIRTILKNEGIDADTGIKLIFNLGYPELAASLIAGRISTALLPEPFATMALRGNKDARDAFPLLPLWKAASGQDDYPMTVVVAKASLIRERPLAVKAFLDAYGQSIKKILADPVKAGALVESFELGLKAPVAAAAIPASNYVFIPSAQAKSAVGKLLEVFLASAPASIGAKLPPASFYAELPDGKN